MKDFESPAIELTPSQLVALTRVQEYIRSKKLVFRKTECPICKSESHKDIDNFDMYGLPTATSVCLDCAHVYQRVGFTDDSLSLFYGSIYRPLDRPLVDPWAFFDHQYRKGTAIIDFLKSIPGRDLDFKSLNVVEFGTGAGGILKAFEDAGAQAYGCDLDDSFIKSSQNRLKCRIQLCEADVFIGWLKSNSVSPDIIILEQVLEHILDVQALLEILKGICTKDSLIYIGVPSLGRFLGEKDWLRKFIQIPHVHYFTSEKLIQVFAASGYSMVKSNNDIRSVFVLDESAAKRTADPESGPTRARDILALLEASSETRPRPSPVKKLKTGLKRRLRPAFRSLKYRTAFFATLLAQPNALSEHFLVKSWIGKNIEAKDKLETRDRSVIEKVIFPRILRRAKGNPGFNVVLVGAHRFSFWYGRLLKELGVSAIVLEIDPAFAKYPGVMQCDATEMSFHLSPPRCDVLIINGVFGYGIDSFEQIDRLVRECEKVVGEDGAIIVGYREGIDDSFISRFKLSGFRIKPYSGLPGHLQTHTDNRHAFICLGK